MMKGIGANERNSHKQSAGIQKFNITPKNV